MRILHRSFLKVCQFRTHFPVSCGKIVQAAHQTSLLLVRDFIDYDVGAMLEMCLYTVSSFLPQNIIPALLLCENSYRYIQNSFKHDNH